MFLGEASGETEIGKLDVAASVQENVVGFDVTVSISIVVKCVITMYIPMDEPKLVHGFNSQHNLSHVEPRDVFAKDLVLDEHCHQVATRQELHEHVEECRVLERSVQLDEPWALCVGENVALRADVGKLILFVLRDMLA